MRLLNYAEAGNVNVKRFCKGKNYEPVPSNIFRELFPVVEPIPALLIPRHLPRIVFKKII